MMNISDIWPLWVSSFLIAMSKGGFPVGMLGMQLVVLLWPGQVDQARSGIGFILPLLCLMDVFAVWTYRRHIDWKSVAPLFPWAAAGVAAATPVFLMNNTAVKSSDSLIAAFIGCTGILFVVYELLRKVILKRLEGRRPSSMVANAGVGFCSGVVSLVAHAAGPIMQMYLLPRKQAKEVYAASLAAFFLVLNMIKLPLYILTDSTTKEMVTPILTCLPFVPLGVLSGYWMVRILPQKVYVALIYGILFCTSLRLIGRAVFSA